MKRAETLEKIHGTYREFEDAAWATLGECSADEIMLACRTYASELAAARLADLNDRIRPTTETVSDATT